MNSKLLPNFAITKHCCNKNSVRVSLCTCTEIPEGIYLEAELLGHGVCTRSILHNTAKLLSNDLLILTVFSPHTLPKHKAL